MQCPACGTTNRPDAKFCDDCGTRLSRVCPRCGTPQRPEAKFCDECGTPLGLAAGPTAPLATPPRHAQTIVIEDELRIVTVIFADVSGFTALSELLAPEEVTDIMNGCFEVIVAPIVRYEGVVDKYVGDAVMARFGAPLAHEDDAERALHAALEMQQALREYNARRWPGQEPRLRLRIGINTGDVMAGSVGAVGSQSYTVMGDTVNLASRLEHECPVGSILIGERTYRAAAEAFEFRALPPMEICGKAEPVQTYEVLSAKSVRSAPLAAARHTPLIGRELELATLTAVIGRARAGESLVVALSGEPGIGKSRLLSAAAEQFPELRWLRTTNLSYERHVPYAMFRQLLATIRAAAPEALSDLGAEHAAALHSLQGAALSDSETQRQARLNPQARQRALYSAFEALLRQLAQPQPLALVCDDLHWSDPSSLLLLEHLIHRRLPLLIVVLFRPDVDTAWQSLAERVEATEGERVTRLRLGRLSREHSDELLQALMPAPPLPATVADQIADKADGNPFFTEELVRSVIEQGMIKLVDGAWHQVMPVLSLPVSDSVQTAIASRIDSLPPASKITLQTSAVIGRRFPMLILSHVIQPGINPVAELPVLQSREFVSPETTLDEPGWMFKQALTQSIAYGSLLRRRRKMLHAAIANGLSGSRATTMSSTWRSWRCTTARPSSGSRLLDTMCRPPAAPSASTPTPAPSLSIVMRWRSPPTCRSWRPPSWPRPTRAWATCIC